MSARVLLLGALGCGGLASHPSAAEWSEVSSEHFAMWTDGDVAHARETLAALEHTRSIVLGVAFPTVESHRKTLVIAFRDQRETSHYIPETAAAQTWPSTPLQEPLIIMAADADEKNQRTLTHELTHVITFQFIHRQPPWFAEGIASFFETVSLDSTSADVRVGEPSPERVYFVQRRELDPVADVFACDRLACYSNPFYATSWALITYLLNERPALLARYEQALQVAPHPPAWSDVVPELPTAALQHEVGLWLIRGRHTVWRYKLHLQPWPTTVRNLSEADVHAIKGLLLWRLHPDESRIELETAVAREPTNLIANLALHRRENEIPVPEMRALVAAHGDDWRAWRLLAVALRLAHDPEVHEAHARMCELLAKDPHADPPQGLTCSTVAPP